MHCLASLPTVLSPALPVHIHQILLPIHHLLPPVSPWCHRYVLQKLTLVGLLVFFQPGTLEQLTLGLIVCFFYFGLCCYLQPFGSKADNLMVCVTQFSLFIAMIAAIIIEHGGPDTPQSIVIILTVAALIPSALSITLTLQMLLNELGIHPLGLCWRPIEKALARRIFRALPRPTSQLPHPMMVMASEKATARAQVESEVPPLQSPTALQNEMDALRLMLAEERQVREAAERAVRELEGQLREAAEANLQQSAPAAAQVERQVGSLRVALPRAPLCLQAEAQPQSSAPSRIEGSALVSSLEVARHAAVTERLSSMDGAPQCLHA